MGGMTPYEPDFTRLPEVPPVGTIIFIAKRIWTLGPL
jgi:hypothetical protein